MLISYLEYHHIKLGMNMTSHLGHSLCTDRQIHRFADKLFVFLSLEFYHFLFYVFLSFPLKNVFYKEYKNIILTFQRNQIGNIKVGINFSRTVI